MKDAFFDEMDHILQNITDKYSISRDDMGPWHNPPEAPKLSKSAMVDPEDVRREKRKQAILNGQPPKHKVKLKNPFA